jgi:hypothetical protein
MHLSSPTVAFYFCNRSHQYEIATVPGPGPDQLCQAGQHWGEGSVGELERVGPVEAAGERRGGSARYLSSRRLLYRSNRLLQLPCNANLPTLHSLLSNLLFCNM